MKECLSFSWDGYGAKEVGVLVAVLVGDWGIVVLVGVFVGVFVGVDV